MMKRVCAMLAAMLPLVIAGCKKPKAEESESTAPVAEVAIAATTPAAKRPESTPAPMATATPPAAAPAPELAPPGVFYLLSTARVETSDGIHGLPPGTGVKLVRPGIYLTPAGEAPLRDDQLTNDMALARRAMQADRSAQVAVKQQTAAAAAKASMATTKTLVDGSGAHEAALKEIDKQRLAVQIATLQAQRDGLEGQMNTLQAKRSRELSNEFYKGRTIASTTETSLNSVRAQIQTVNEQISQAQRALDALR